MALINLKKLAEAAHKDLTSGKLDDCYTKVLYLLDSNPDHYFYLYLLGSYYSKRGNIGASILAYEKAVSVCENFSEAINNLGGCYRKAGMYDKAMACFEKAVEIGKSDKFKRDTKADGSSLLADYVSNLGSIYVGMHNPEKALGYLNEAINIYNQCGNARWNRSLALLEMGDYENGFIDYDFGDRMDAKKHRNYRPGQGQTPLWEGEKDKTVVVHGEQGIGDELMFATILPDLAKDCKKVIFDAHPRLYTMFRRSFAEYNIDVYGTRKDNQLVWPNKYEIDYRIPIGSIAKFYRKRLEDFPKKPYLKAKESEVAIVNEKLDLLPAKKLNIGLSWKGGTATSSKTHRILPMKHLDILFNELDANFISLQYHENGKHEVDRYNEQSNNNIYHWQKIIDDYDLTCALLSRLDLVISVPQSIIHLAGVMGVKAYQLSPYNYIWQMGVYGKQLPWYSSITSIWQRSPDDWEYVVLEACRLAKEEFVC